MRKELGKIDNARWGLGGYQDAMIGLSLSFSMKPSSSVSTFVGAWAIERSDFCQWTEEERLKQIGEAGMKVVELLNKIGKRDVKDLIGTPVELTFDGQSLRDWRLLDEVL